MRVSATSLRGTPMSTAVTYENVDTLDEFDNDDLEKVFDGIAREHLGISGAEFIKKLDGDGFDEADHTSVMYVAMFRPSGR